MLVTRTTRYYHERELFTAWASLHARTGVLVSDKAYRESVGYTTDPCWYMTWQYFPCCPGQRGNKRVYTRKWRAATSFARAIVAARRNRLARRLRGA